MGDETLPSMAALGPPLKRATRRPPANELLLEPVLAQEVPELWARLPRDAQNLITSFLRDEAPSEKACLVIESVCAYYGFRECKLERFWDQLNASWGWYGPHASWVEFAAAHKAKNVRYMHEIDLYLAAQFLEQPLLWLNDLPRTPRAYFHAGCRLRAELRARLARDPPLHEVALATQCWRHFDLPANVFIPLNRELLLAILGSGDPHRGLADTTFVYTDDGEVARATLAHGDRDLGLFSPRLRDDFETVRIAVEANIFNFQYASERLRGNVTMCLVALASPSDGFVYDNFLEPAKSNPEVIMQVVRTGRRAFLHYAAPLLMGNDAFFYRLVKEVPGAIRFLGFMNTSNPTGQLRMSALYIDLVRVALARDPTVRSYLHSYTLDLALA